jgi:leucine dehydrogenase
VAIQGVGKVGALLVDDLVKDGAELTICDICEENVKKVQAKYPVIKVVGCDEIFGVECGIFSPCALGGVLNDETIPLLKCKIIAGSANNQLLEERHGDLLHERGILYAPDFVVNAGGLIQVADELEMHGTSKARVMKKTEAIYNILLKIFAVSKEKNIPTYKVADMLAEERINTIGRIKVNYIKK